MSILLWWYNFFMFYVFCYVNFTLVKLISYVLISMMQTVNNLVAHLLEARLGKALREGCKYSKWKFKMDFSTKWGGDLEFHIPILKNYFLKNQQESFPDYVLHFV